MYTNDFITQQVNKVTRGRGWDWGWGAVGNYCKLTVETLAVHNILQNVMKTHLLRSFNIIED